MRTMLGALVIILLSGTNLFAQKEANIQGHYKRVVKLIPQGQMSETIALIGQDSGTFTFMRSGTNPHGGIPSTDTGNWIKSKITHFKSKKEILVIILYCNDKSISQYYELEKTGNLKRVFDFGGRFSKGSAYTYKKQ